MRMRMRWRNRLAAAHDAVMAACAFVLALYLRLGTEQFHLTEPYLVYGTLLFTAICVGVFYSMRLYRGLWRYASLPDLVALTRAVSLAVVVFTACMFALTRLNGLPRSVPFILWLLLLAMLGAPRFLYRALKDRTLVFTGSPHAVPQVPLLLVGATGSAELFIRDCLRNPAAPYKVVGILDDALGRQKGALLGVDIVGRIDALEASVQSLARKGMKPQRLILALDDASGQVARSLLARCEALGIALGRLPALSEFKNGADSKPGIRPVALEDLLGRAQTVHDRASMQNLITGKRVLVTGAGGSIGGELARQIARCAPAQLLLLEQSEFALYTIDQEIGETYPALPRAALLTDVRDAAHVHAVFAQYKPELVFHAAAVKHVPLSEDNPIAAIETNIFGTCQVAEACTRYGTQAMVLISTDKAVHPTNIMGATKRLAERCVHAQAQAGGATRFFTVRFGNVLGSTGSVVPLFQRQLASGGPLTVTHPDMVRYFMTIREAVELVIQAAALGLSMQQRQDAIFVLDMGTPMRVVDLATQMIRLAGLKPEQDVKIIYTGLRPGEKLFEELFYDAESVTRTDCPGILLAAAENTPLSLEKPLAELRAQCRERDVSGAVGLLKLLVPEYSLQQAEKKYA